MEPRGLEMLSCDRTDAKQNPVACGWSAGQQVQSGACTRCRPASRIWFVQQVVCFAVCYSSMRTRGNHGSTPTAKICDCWVRQSSNLEI